MKENLLDQLNIVHLTHQPPPTDRKIEPEIQRQSSQNDDVIVRRFNELEGKRIEL